MKPPRLRFSIFTLLVVTAVIAVGVMLYQRYVVRLAAEDEFKIAIATQEFRGDTFQRMAKLSAQYPDFGRLPGAVSWAVLGGQYDLCERFLEAGGKADDRYVQNQSAPLVFASMQNRRDLAKLLIEHGADVQAPLDHGGFTHAAPTYLHLAAQYDRAEMCELLLKHDVDMHAPNNQGETALHLAIRSRNIEVVRLLLEHEAADSTHPKLPSPLALAMNLRDEAVRTQTSTYGYDEIILLLEDHYPPTNP